MARPAPTFRSFVAAGVPAAGTKERASFVNTLAVARVKEGRSKNLDAAKRMVQRQITDAGQKRGQSAPISRSERSAARAFFKSHEIVKEKVDGAAARSADPKYRLLVEKFESEAEARARAEQIAEGTSTAAKTTGKGGSPTIIDHATQIEIEFVPEGGRFADGPESGSSYSIAESGGAFIVTVRGD